MTMDQKDEKTLIGPSPFTQTGSLVNGTALQTNPFGGTFEHAVTGTDAFSTDFSSIAMGSLPVSAVISMDLGEFDAAEEKNKKYLIVGLAVFGLLLSILGGITIISVLGNTSSKKQDIEQAMQYSETQGPIEKLEAKASKIGEKIVAAPEVGESADITEVAEGDTPFGDSGSEALENPVTNQPLLASQAIEPLQTRGEASDEQFEKWQEMLDHKFVYQQYKATEEMHQQKQSRVEDLLEIAMKKPKFWTRINALDYYLQLGGQATPEHVQAVIGNARPTLVKNYLKRFRVNPTPSEQKIVELVNSATMYMH